TGCVCTSDRCSAAPVERAPEIVDEVVHRFEADGEAHQAVCDAERRALLGCEPGMGDLRGEHDQGIYTAQARGHDRQADLGDEAIGSRGAGLELEAQRAPESLKEVPGPGVTRMLLQPGVVDARHRGMSGQKPGDPESALVLVTHAYAECL